ncbi:MAG: serine/threonine protein kinase [Verrucomicrobiae bacterium]|nr:serine/threonine protein kinase [Verrucomicrobiae bacterium]
MPAEPIHCPECRALIPSSAPAGLCVACLLRLAESEPQEPAPIETPAAPTRRLGNYEILRELGRGGMGVVYEAQQRRPTRTVALKVILHGEWASELDVARFREEAEAVASLDHPHIVPIYEVGEHDGRHFYSMKLCAGGNLDQNRARFLSDPKATARLLSQIARAVHCAHQHGILHRDLKPANLLFDTEGQPYVADFGLARFQDRERRLTRSSILPGTPEYLAPERISGQRQLTVASDIWSLGIILYELLAGRRPFTADSVPQLLRRILETEPDPFPGAGRRSKKAGIPPKNGPSPRAPLPSPPRDLQLICLKCLEKAPARRYSSAEALADDLDRWLRHEPVQAQPTGWTKRTAKWIRRHPVRVTLILALAVALLTPTAVATWFILRLNQSRGHHPIRRVEGTELILPLFNWRHGRCTDNFAGTTFNEEFQQRVRLEFVGLPDQVRDRLKVHVRADWAIFADPVRSSVVGHGEEFLLAVKMERKWLQDTLLYFVSDGWDAGEITATYTNAAIRLTLLNPRSYDPRVPE